MIVDFVSERKYSNTASVNSDMILWLPVLLDLFLIFACVCHFQYLFPDVILPAFCLVVQIQWLPAVNVGDEAIAKTGDMIQGGHDSKIS